MKNLGMNGKFTVVILIFVITVLGVLGNGIYSVVTVKNNSKEITETVAERRRISDRALIHAFRASVDQKDLLLSRDPSKSAAFLKDYEESMVETRADIGTLVALSDESIKKGARDASEFFEKWAVVSKQVNDLALAQKYSEGYDLLVNSSEPLNDKMEEYLMAANKLASQAMIDAQEKEEKIYLYSRNLGIGLSLGGLLFGLLMALPVVRNITRSIYDNACLLNESVNQIASASAQAAVTSQNLSEAATEQASALEETSAAIEEMNSMVARNAQAAKDSTEIAKKSVDSANRGQKVVQNMIVSMDEITDSNKEIMRQTNESNLRIAEIVQVINEIGNKTRVINEIVFQTKLLSFNASVEAARAGEHGKGFSVVAEEVGKLAQMSGNAAKDITTLLDGSNQKVQAIVSDSKSKIEKIIGESSLKVDSGTRIARECRDVLSDIVQGISSVSEMVDSISSASDEQSRGINEINRAIIQLDQVTQANAATSEAVANASDHLSSQASQMKENVGSLMRIVTGPKGQAAPLETRVDPPKSQAQKSSLSKTAGKPAKAGKSRSEARLAKSASVIHLGRTGPSVTHSSEPILRATGSDGIPSEDDPRFKDI